MTALLEVKGLNMHFPVLGGLLRRPIGNIYAVNDVTFTLNRGETLGIVGESGCGKTTLGRAIVRLYQPTSGSVVFDGQDVTTLDAIGLRSMRRNMQMIFQDPYASLNPRKTVRDTLEEPMKLHKTGDRRQRYQQITRLLKLVGLRPGDMYRYPHEFSGGQRQRIGIARALTLNPGLVVADEPVSALDVSIQSQVLNLLVDLQKELDLTYIFISHDLTVVKYISDRVAVMYLGNIVEMASAADIYKKPMHPYTKALLSSVPVPDPRKRASGEVLEGDVPSPRNPPPGCPFHTRCKYAQDVCKVKVPMLDVIDNNLNNGGDHSVACHFAEDIQRKERSSDAT